MLSGRAFVIVAVSGSLLGLPRASAALAPGIRCQAAKLREAGRAARGLLLCHAEAAKQGEAVAPACAGAAESHLAARFARREGAGDCVTTGDATLVQADLEQFVNAAAAALRPAATPSACASVKLRATGRAARGWLQAFARDKASPDLDQLNADVTDVQERMASRFKDAEENLTCLTASDAQAITDIVFGLPQVPPQGVVRVVARLSPACGDGVASSTEPCDVYDAAGCPGTCTPDCRCAVCGDDHVNQPGEQCDGTDGGACPGAPCNADCTCPAPLCGNGVRDPGEECDGTDLHCAIYFPGQCLPPGDPHQCECCGLDFDLCSTDGYSGCCPGYTCVPTGGPGPEGACRLATSCGTLETVCAPSGLACCPGYVCAPPNGYPTYPYSFCCRPPGGSCAFDSDCCVGTCASGTCS